VRGSIEEAEELQDEDGDGRRDDEDGGEKKVVKPASRERQKELLGRLPPPQDRQRGRQMDYSPYEPKQHSHNNYDQYDNY